MSDINLYGRIFITAHIEAVTGLHIGGSSVGLEIGGLDKAVIRNPLTNQPYIPGSSLRGKMRSQTEKVVGAAQNKPIGQVTIHTCQKREDYEANGGCPVCHIFGVPGEMDFSGPTRLVVRDVQLDLTSDQGKQVWENTKLDLPYAELKTEVAIDRVTSAAVPRTLERVPAGAIFGPAELVFSIFEKADFGRLKYVVEALQLVEDDYIGGAGSRGSGKVRFMGLNVCGRSKKNYSQEQVFRKFGSVQELAQAMDALKTWAETTVPVG